MRLMLMFLAFVFFDVPSVLAQQDTPFHVDSLTVGLWHFDEVSGFNVGDSSGLGNDGSAIGTTIVNGHFGKARQFNGSGDYVIVPSDSSLDFGDSSFSVSVWFKTTTDYGFLIRRGMAPAPGFQMSIYQGHLACQIGSRQDATWPDTVLTIISEAKFNDGLWHLGTMVRDRSFRTLSLYADGNLISPPMNDVLTIPLNSDHPLTIGCWENFSLPYFFDGTIDEVRISSQYHRRSATRIRIEQTKLAFGITRVGTSGKQQLTIANSGFADSLVVHMTSSQPSLFSCPTGPIIVPPLSFRSVEVVYAPILTGQDTATISIESNDPFTPLVTLPVSGRGFSIEQRPSIAELERIPYDARNVRVIWIRSIYDTTSATDPVTEYSIWRGVNGTNIAAQTLSEASVRNPLSGTLGPLWDFLQTVPAMGFDRYAAIVPLSYDVTTSNVWNVFMVAAHTKNLQVYTSIPDSILRSGTTISTAPTQTESPTEFQLYQNYPNPFNPTTTIAYAIPQRAHVSLTVSSVLGEEVARIFEGDQEAGYHQVRLDASRFASGMYFYRIVAGRYSMTKKLLLLR